MKLTPSPMKISEAARLAALLNARLMARPGRLELEAVSVPGIVMQARPTCTVKPAHQLIGG